MTKQVASVQPVGQPGGGDRGDRRGIGDHELDPGRRMRGVDRQIRRSGLEHRQDRHDRLGGALQTAAPHSVPVPAPFSASMCANRFAASSSSRYVIDRSPNVTATASGVRATWASNSTGIDTGVAGRAQHRPVADLIQPGMFTRDQHIHRREPAGGIGGHRHQRPLEPLGERLDACCVEDIGVELDPKTQFATRKCLQRQRIVGGFTGGELG